MILFERAAAPAVRAGEEEIGGRRLAGRLFPYGPEGGSEGLRFDPVARRFASRRPGAPVPVGPPAPEAWRAAAGRLPPGPVLVGPGSVAESVRGAYRAAAEGALAAGRGVYLLDPDAGGIPEGGDDAVVLCTFAPGSRGPFPGLAAAGARRIARGVLFPLVPGWTAEPGAIEELLSAAVAGGAHSATPLLVEADGDSRRAIVEARGQASPGDDGFFERIHHGDWIPRMAERLAGVRGRCAARGLAVLPPRPVGRRDPAGNAAASARLEELAELAEGESLAEHRAALLRAAVRWIDESGRDLAAVAREGNFRRVFPFDGDVATAAEAALGAG